MDLDFKSNLTFQNLILVLVVMFKVQNPQGKLVSLCFLVLLSSFLSNVRALQVVQMAQWGEFNQTLFQQQYPGNSTNEPSAESPQVCNRGDNQYFSLNNNPKCRWSLNVCQQTLKQITRIDSSAQSLMPGTIVQLFADKAVQIPSISYIRPVSIVLSNGINATFPFITSPKEWAQQLTDFLYNFYQQLNQRRIEIKVVQPGRMEKALQTLGLSTAIYEHLLIARSHIHPLQLSKRILAVFHQKFFTASLKLPKNANLIGHFFGDNQGLANADPLNLIYNLDNPLEFISRANFGRLLLISVDSTEKAEDQMADLMKCTLQGPLEPNCVGDAMNSILRNPTLRYYFAGMEESFPLVYKCDFCKANIEWQRIFFPINASTVSKLRPLSAEAISFTGQPHQHESTRFFETEDCSKQISVNISKIDEGNSLSLRISNNIFPANRSTIRPVRHLFNTTHPGTFQIGSQVGKEVFDLKFLAKGRREPIGMKFFFLKKVPIYTTQIEFALLINGEKKISQIIGKSRSHRQFTQVNIRIDPQTRTSRILFIQSYETDSPGEALRSAAPEIKDFNQIDY